MNSKRKKEFYKLVRFVIVGGSTFIFQSILYYAFSRWLFLDLPHTASYMLAIGFAAVQNYVTHRAWTFGDQKAAQGSVYRFFIVLMSGLMLNIFLFWLFHDVFHWYDLLVVFLVGAITPFFTYLTHRLYTFHENPGAALQRIVRKRDRLVS